MIIPRELLAIGLAVVLMPVFVGCHILLFRRKKETTPGFVHLFAAFSFYGAAWLAAAFAVWGAALSVSQVIAGWSTAGFVCLAYMQVFSQICRGFSLRIMVDIERAGPLDVPGIMREYSEGRGVDWLMEKRIVVLEGLGLLARERDGLALGKPWGLWVGRIGIWIKRILKPGQGG